MGAGQTDEYLQTYKIMPRHANAHAYVNAGFRMMVDTTGVVSSLTTPTMVFGGLTAKAWSPTATPAFLMGKNITDTAVVIAAAELLASEIVPTTPPAASSAAYRSGLAVNLFYKFIVSCLPQASPLAQSAGTVYERAISQGSVSYDKGDPSIYPVSLPMPKVTAILQTTGQAIYANDLPAGPRTL